LKEIPIHAHGRICPVCGAHDAFIDTLHKGDEFYVECLNCHVYRASRRAFRLFQYLRDKGDAESLAKLGRLAERLNARGRGGAAQLNYEDWEEFGTARASHSSSDG
jgi:hypothetical protein